jgi:hypothetical protein
MSYMRAVRFTDVDPDQIARLLSRVEAAGGPPEGVTTSGLQVLHDEEQRTAIVLQHFESIDDLRSSEAIFEAMPAGDTPGTRASVDRCELKLDLRN